MAEQYLDDAAWAEAQFGPCALGDARRTRRAVTLAAQVAARPSASLPAQTATWDDLRAAYTLLHQPAVTRGALQAPHCAATRRRAAACGAAPVLFVQDTTTLDFTGHRAARGLGPVGAGQGEARGLLAHSLLALTPAPAADGAPMLLGLAHQAVWARAAKGRGRAPAPNEGRCWAEALQAVGPAPAASCWVSVGDAAADTHGHLRAAVALGWHALVRSGKPHRAVAPDGGAGPRTSLRAWAAALAPRATTTLTLRGRDGAPARTATLQVAWAAGALRAPQAGPERGGPALPATVVRVWEAGGGADAPDWVLLTTLPVAGAADAVRAARWYACRWLAEEYHKALKTGCRVERSQLRTAAALATLVGLLGVVAVRLLQLRAVARAAPDAPAATVADPDLLAVVARARGLDAAALTARRLWRELAGLGGFLGRKGDGEPGWQTLWRGWEQAQGLLAGYRLAVGR